ncbi:tripartite motif-containing protein 16-like isoform X2 [Trichomycterus rosablanca]|uniref:tripartite motif-containing protein 16-like isoform X2 n=1 Tax=Trichomycterus rosablanca TaxID=2290929 RepID=UPI002F3585B8
MAEAFIPVDQFSMDQFSCPVCLDLLKDPVATPCGHSFCKVCINGCWDQEDGGGIFSCPQCRKTFSPRPDLCRNTMLAEVVEKLKKTELQTASFAQCHTKPGDVECDFCTEKKHKAVKSCLMCLVSFCETHLKPHYEVPGLKKHTLVEACGDLQEKICSQHDEVLKIYCRTDQSFICYLCTMEDHEGHKTVTIKTERKEKQNEVKDEQRKSQQRIQEKQKKLQDLQHTVNIIKGRADAAVQNNEKIFTELISFMEKKRSEMTKLIRDHKEAELSLAQQLIQQLEQEITELMRREAELEELSQSHDNIHFLQNFPSLCVSSGCEDSSSITINEHLSFDGVNRFLSDLKKRIMEFCEGKHYKNGTNAVAEPKRREDLLQYFCEFSLDPNTANRLLILSEKNKVVTFSDRDQQYSDHSERFDIYTQVLCKEEVSGCCYWEVEWSGYVEISVSYKEISRKGPGNECVFGYNDQSWSLCCSSSSSSTFRFYHNNIKTELEGSSASRIGVYVDHSAGTLSFYSISDTMRLLHRVQTTFTQPLYAGFQVGFGFGFWEYNSSARFFDRK